MKKIYSFLMILAAAAGFTNCTKTNLDENKETEKGGAVVYATTDAVTKTTLADDYKVLWSEDDQIKFVKDGATTITYTFALESGEGTTSGTFKCDDTPADGSYTVYYPASYDGANWPAQTYVGATDISGAPMVATATVSEGKVSDISFKNEGGILRYTVKGSKTIKSINVKSESPALDVTLDCGDGVDLTEEGTVFNIALPEGTYTDATLTFTATDYTVATMTASEFIVKKNVVYRATFGTLTFKAVVTLPGEFSIGESGKVKFSRGNLYWDGDSFEFEANQYTIGTWNAENHVNYFFWSKEESVAKAASYSDASAATTDVFFTNETATTAKTDFEVSGEKGFRTLSADEWTYLLATRENAADLLAEDVTVCGVEHCLIIAPDACLNDYAFNNTKTSYDAADWATAEAAGLICLPPAGYRDGTEVKSGEGNGFYWASTTDAADKASNLGFKKSDN